MKNKLSILALVACAFFWGGSGVLTQVALKEISTMVLIFVRFAIASLMCFICFRHIRWDKKHLIHGTILATLLVVIYVSSTLGLKYTTASNAGFIIGSAVVLVPIFDFICNKTRFKKIELLSIAMCFIGLFFVTFKGDVTLNKGDFYCFIDACAYGAYILYNGQKTKGLQTEALVTIQYTLVALVTGLYCLASHSLVLPESPETWLVLLVLGFFCTFLAFYMQVRAQKNVSAHYASRLLTLIPIFSVGFDMIFLDTWLSMPLVIGGSLIILSTLVDQFKGLKALGL